MIISNCGNKIKNHQGSSGKNPLPMRYLCVPVYRDLQTIPIPLPAFRLGVSQFQFRRFTIPIPAFHNSNSASGKDHNHPAATHHHNAISHPTGKILANCGRIDPKIPKTLANFQKFQKCPPPTPAPASRCLGNRISSSPRTRKWCSLLLSAVCRTRRPRRTWDVFLSSTVSALANLGCFFVVLCSTTKKGRHGSGAEEL